VRLHLVEEFVYDIFLHGVLAPEGSLRIVGVRLVDRVSSDIVAGVLTFYPEVTPVSVIDRRDVLLGSRDDPSRAVVVLTTRLQIDLTCRRRILSLVVVSHAVSVLPIRA
jgi:hypothetical protein